MKAANENIETAITLAEHLGEKVESITFEAIRENENGAGLYAVTCESGEIRYVIIGETGSPLGCYEDKSEALHDWNVT